MNHDTTTDTTTIDPAEISEAIDVDLQPNNAVGPGELVYDSYEWLCGQLEARGNVLSVPHRSALLQLLHTFGRYVERGNVDLGRVAVPLPTGMGKTSAIVAFIATMYRRDELVPVSVAASQAMALGGLKRDLMKAGVPEHLIGLKYSATVKGARNLPPSTGDESRVIQLVTHQRVRGGRNFQLFAEHEGRPRALMIWDETFLRSEPASFDAQDIRRAASRLADEIEHGQGNAALQELSEYLSAAWDQLEATLEVLRATDPAHNGRVIDLPQVDPAHRQRLRATARRHRKLLGGLDGPAKLLGDDDGDDLDRVFRAVCTSQGGGLVTARDTVNIKLKNVVILDASTPISRLVELDPTVKRLNDFRAASLKSFERVEINQILSYGGRYSIEPSLLEPRAEDSLVAQEVAHIIRTGWKTERAFLVITFKGEPAEKLRAHLRHLGIDLDATVGHGEYDPPRVQFLTWGSHTSLNGLEYCDCVILAGISRRSDIDISAAIRGQIGNPAEPTPHEEVQPAVDSEMACAIYQAASRGSCRRIDNGKAHPMRLWLIHQDPKLRLLLDEVMPDAVWKRPEPMHLQECKDGRKLAEMLDRLITYLTHLEGVDEISGTAVKRALGLDKAGSSVDQSFKAAGKLLRAEVYGWSRPEGGRSFVRGWEEQRHPPQKKNLLRAAIVVSGR